MRALVVLLLMAGCQRLDEPQPLQGLDEPFFRCNVQPVLTKSCASLRCHGDGNRYYKIFTRNRLRYGLGEDRRNATLQEIERAYNFNASIAQVDLDEPLESLLLLKPLDQAGGGYYHGGAVEYEKGDVFLSRDEPDFQTLQAWVTGMTEDPTCIEPGSNL